MTDPFESRDWISSSIHKNISDPIVENTSDLDPVLKWSLRRDLLLRLRYLEIASVKLLTQSQDV